MSHLHNLITKNLKTFTTYYEKNPSDIIRPILYKHVEGDRYPDILNIVVTDAHPYQWSEVAHQYLVEGCFLVRVFLSKTTSINIAIHYPTLTIGGIFKQVEEGRW